MTDVTLADVLKKVKDDLAWRGPTGRVLGNIVLPRAYAECLDRVVRMVLKERDELVYEREHRDDAKGKA